MVSERLRIQECIIVLAEVTLYNELLQFVKKWYAYVSLPMVHLPVFRKKLLQK